MSVPPETGWNSKQFPDDVQQVAASLLGRDEKLHLVAEQQGAHLVIVQDGREGQHGGDFRQHVPLGLDPGAESAAAAHVHQQHHRHLALFLEHLYIGRTQARGHVPVHVPHIVTILILTHFAEGHAASLERRMVLAREDLVGQGPRADFNLPDLFQQVCRTGFRHGYGTITAFNVSAMISSGVTFSASAS